MADTAPTMTAPETAAPQATVVVKKYANRRLYNTETSSYITLDNLADMIRAGRDFVVYDAKSGEDITRGVLTQIIVEEESKGSAMLPTNFLRQLIGFYGGSLQGVVPNYLEQAMATFARQQQQMRQVVQQTFGPFIPVGVEEMSRQNLAVIERAMTMFNPFARAGDAPRATPSASEPAPEAQATEAQATEPQATELTSLRHEVETLRAQLAIARAESVMQTALAAPAADIPEAVAMAPAAELPALAAETPATPPMHAAPAPLPRKGRPGRKT